MKINKNITELAVNTGYEGDWGQEMLQYMWNNRNKAQLFIASVASVSRNGMNRKIKLGMVYKGSFVDVTHLVAKVTENKFDQDHCAVSVSGCGMDMIFYLLKNLFSRLSAKKGRTQAYRFNAVQSYVSF